MIVEVWHYRTEDDVIREQILRWEYALPESPQAPPTFPNDYRKVAVVSAEGPELDAMWSAFQRTNNISRGWHENPGVLALVEAHQRRSSSNGDVFVVNGTPYLMQRTGLTKVA